MKLLIILLLFVNNFSIEGKSNLNVKKKLIKKSTTTILIDSLDIGRYYFKDEYDNSFTLDSDSNTIFINKEFIELFDAKLSLSFLIYPNESIRIVNANNYPTFITGNTQRDKELYFPIDFYLHFSITEDISNLPKYSFVTDEYRLDPQRRDSILISKELEELNYLNDYCKKYSLSIKFKVLNSEKIKYSFVSKLMMCGYFNFTKKYISEKTNLFLSYGFHKYLPLISNYRLANRIFLLVDTKENKLEILESIIKLPSKKQQIFASAQTLYLLYQKNKFYLEFQKETEMLLFFLKKKDGLGEYYNYLVNFELEDNINEDELLDINLGVQKIENLSLKKINYVDFWASWCAPCLREIPYFYSLEHLYKDRDINFITISLDRDVNVWKRKLGLLTPSSKNAYYIGNKGNFNWVKNFEISAIPRYLIIDRYGNIIENDAPRPSDPKIREVLDELLKER